MDREVNREKVRRIFQEVTADESITPGEFEEMISNLSGEELLMLRELLVNARCNGIKTLAERGWPLLRSKPN